MSEYIEYPKMLYPKDPNGQPITVTSADEEESLEKTHFCMLKKLGVIASKKPKHAEEEEKPKHKK